MSILDETCTQANDVRVPRLGLGTWVIDDDAAALAVRAAVETGYRAVDTAQAYGNERGVGEGIRTCGVPWEELFVSTKLAAEIKEHDGAVAAIEESLALLDIGCIDLMLIHSPQPWDDFRGGGYADGNLQAWRALEEAHRAGKIRAIGVSNFLESDLENLVEGGTVAPHADQLLVHAGNTPSELLAYCRERDILVQAYSPIAHGVLLENPRLTAMAQTYGATVPQLCIRYTLQPGTQSLPKTADPEHLRSNVQVDLEISAEDMCTLQDLDERDYGENSVFPVYSGK